MGKDKYENEDLIKYGHPEDCWFHVDDLSSAHGEPSNHSFSVSQSNISNFGALLLCLSFIISVYLRLKTGMTLVSLKKSWRSLGYCQ